MNIAQSTYGYTAVRGTVTVKSGKARKTPSTKGQFVFGVTKDETVTIIGEEKGDDGNTWYKVKVLGTVGYLRSDLVKKTNIEVKSESTPDSDKKSEANSSTNKSQENQAANGSGAESNATGNNASSGQTNGTTGPCVKGSNVIVREGATTKSGIRVVLQNGHGLTVNATEKGKDDGRDWCSVSFKANGKDYKGYIRSDLVNMNGQVNADAGNSTGADNNDNGAASEGNSNTSGNKPQVGKIKGTGVNIRTAPVDGKVIGRLTTGNQITATDQVKASDGKVWFAVSFIYNKQPQTGYVRSDLTEGISIDENLSKEEVKEEEKKEE
ncbi:MAG: SH3 domain-containing protein, partial [Lachnospiraceae bacterium]|nr:SH3 domain-containing protein [Lachnospiraceae bacterium]